MNGFHQLPHIQRMLKIVTKHNHVTPLSNFQPLIKHQSNGNLSPKLKYSAFKIIPKPTNYKNNEIQNHLFLSLKNQLDER